jgi:chromosome segregation ATPase
MHITRLETENVKRLTSVTITPDGNVIVIGGPNGAGKSCVLDSIEMALGGKGHVCKKPIHEGAENARVIVETDQYVITRTFTQSDSYIKVTTKEGYTIGTPQALLDKLVGDLSFDPLEFTRMEPKKQVEIFMRLLGLDFTEADKQFAEIESNRRDIGRDGKALKAQLDAIPADPDAPTAEVVVSDLVAEVEKAQAVNAQNARAHSIAVDVGRRLAAAIEGVAEAERKLQEITKLRNSTQLEYDKAKEVANALVDVDTEPITKQIAEAETINRRVQAAAQRAKFTADYKAKVAAYEEGTASLRAIETFKQEEIAAAKFPIDGVTFGPDGILVNGIPFDQASSAEQLQIAVAMGLSANPELRIILIRDGSLLDETSMAAMAAMAEKYEAQVWIERVGEGQEVAIVIEDGMVKEDRTKQEVPK